MGYDQYYFEVMKTNYFIFERTLLLLFKNYIIPAPIKEAGSIQELFFEPKHYGAFYTKSFIQE